MTTVPVTRHADVDVTEPTIASTPALLASCVVIAFHRADGLRTLLDGLALDGLERVVVNVDADPAVGAVARAGGARVVDLAGNPGYGTAVNVGVGAARADTVVFMNDDARISGDSVLRLAAVVSRGEADVAVPRVEDDEHRLERTIAAVPTPGSLAREWLLLPDAPVDRLMGRVPVEKWRAPTVPERIHAAAAVAVAARRSLLSEVPFPEDYFLYWEESEWFWRLQERDAVVQYRPEVTCVHSGGRADVRPEKSRLLARNAVRCVRRTQGRGAALVAVAVVVAWNLRLVVIDGVRTVIFPRAAARGRLAARVAGLQAACASWREVR